jgi:glycosyltransferase involved in cell wall biosynthesis
MGSVLALANVTIVHLKDSPLLRMAIPSKIQAYMAAGRPIIAGIRGEAASLLLESGAGKVVSPDRPEQIAECVVELFRMTEAERERMGLSGQRYYRANMSMETGVNNIEKIMINASMGKGKASTYLS